MPELERPRTPNKVKLYEIILNAFDARELKELCFYLHLDYDDLEGAERRAKARELVEYFARIKNLPQLVDAIKGLRPDIDIDSVFDDEPAPAAELRNTFLVAYISVLPSEFPRSIVDIPLVKSLPTGALQPNDATGKAIKFAPQIHSLTDDEIILSSGDHAIELMFLVLSIFKEAQARDIPLRAGLHSDVVQQNDAVTTGTADVEGSIKSARQVGRRGESGHILATRQFAEQLNAVDDQDLVIKHLGRRQISNHVRVELYNIYSKSGAFGKSANPRTYSPVPIVQNVSIPAEIRCARHQLLTIDFFPNVEYAKVQFAFKNRNIQIACERQGNEECVFDYYRHENQYTKVFEIWTVHANADSLEPIDILFLDDEDELISPPIRGRIMLRRRTPPPESLDSMVRLPLWVWDRFFCFPWWLKIIVALLIVFASGSFLWLRYSNDDKRRLKEKWGKTPELWKLTEGQGKDDNDKALLVKGPNVGLNDLDGSTLYDFDLSLEMIVISGQRNASWILRAKDRENYYLFVINFSQGGGTKALLQGFVIKDGKPVKEMESRPVDYYFPFTEGTLLFIDINVRDNVFTHTIQISKRLVYDERGKPILDPNQIEMNVKKEVTLVDPDRHYRYGLVGFRDFNGDGEMKVDKIIIRKPILIQ